ncbi:MAG TPA: hypothetical protein PK225_14620 [Azonexus sp.]|nr:hypothetical protein [Azonexus sp.]
MTGHSRCDVRLAVPWLVAAGLIEGAEDEGSATGDPRGPARLNP